MKNGFRSSIFMIFMLILKKNDYICNLKRHSSDHLFSILNRKDLSQQCDFNVTEWLYSTILKIYNHYGKFRLSDPNPPYIR